MRVKLRRIITLILCVCLVVSSSLYVSSLTQAERDKLNNDISALRQEASEIQSEIDRLKKEKSDQSAILAAVRKKIANTQAQIDRCNREIASINAKIDANKAQIANKEAEIASDKLAFQKRIRAIYMTNSGSSAQLLLGAADFSELLQMAQLTSSVASHDKQLIEDLKGEIEELNRINAENEELIAGQVEIRRQIAAQQAELEQQEAEAADIYNEIASEQKENQEDVDKINAEVKRLQKQLEDDIANKSYSSFINPNTGFQWPVSGFFGISAGFQSNDSVHKGRHNGIDIAGSGIAQQPIRAIADGVVDKTYNSCTHNYKKYSNCCGNGYGNYAVINHGTMTVNGSTANYVAWYAHATRITVSPGQSVKQGDVIGYVGTTGWSTGYHLHLGVTRNGTWINPYPLFF